MATKKRAESLKWTAEERDKAIRTVQKLEALASSTSNTTAPEREAALKMAAKLRAKYEIAQGEEPSVSDKEAEIGEMVAELKPVVSGPKPRHEWPFALCAGLAEAHGCLPVFYTMRNGDNAVRIVGTEEDRKRVWDDFGIAFQKIEKGRASKVKGMTLLTLRGPMRDLMVSSWCMAEAVQFYDKARASMSDSLRQAKLEKAKVTFAKSPNKVPSHSAVKAGKPDGRDFLREMFRSGREAAKKRGIL